MTDVFILLIIFGCAFGMFLLYISARNKERMALIEKGADASLFQKAPRPFKIKKTSVVKWGMFLVGLSIGIVVGELFKNYSNFNEVASYMSSILFFGGLSLILFYWVENKLEKNK